MSAHLFILGAFEPELAPLRELIANKSNISIHCVGVGMVTAGANTSKILAEHSKLNKSCLFVGSIGALGREFSLLSLVAIESVRLIDPLVLESQSYFPNAMDTEHFADSNLTSEILSKFSSEVARVKAYSSLAITNTDKLASTLKEKTDHQVENLELFGIASACKLHNTPWASINCITNYVGSCSHQQWKENFSQAANITAHSISKYS